MYARNSKGHGHKATTTGKRNFDSWWATVPEDLRQKTLQIPHLSLYVP